MSETSPRAVPARDLTGWSSVFAPATVANVGPGFDCFGLALERPGDTVRVRPCDEPGVHIVAIEGDGDALPRDASSNTAAVAAAAIWTAAETRPAPGLEMRLEKGLPLGSGLGSSAASAAAGAVAAWHALGRDPAVTRSIDDARPLLAAALDGEAVAAGARHADNIAPALLGGFTIVQGVDPLRIARLEPALDVWIAVATPALSVATRDARACLPDRIPLADATRNWANAAGLVLGLARGDADLVRRSLVDRVIERHRAHLIPSYDEVRAAAVGAGALGAGISGAGPTVFALATNEAVAHGAAHAMGRAFAAGGVDASARVSPLALHGARPA